jgi:hypothetical protein
LQRDSLCVSPGSAGLRTRADAARPLLNAPSHAHSKQGTINAVMAGNYGALPAVADLAIHISQRDPNKPYIETEGGGLKSKYGAYVPPPPSP